MLDRRSALARERPISSPAVSIGVAPVFTLTQVALFSPEGEAAIATVAGPLPSRNDMAIEAGGRSVFRTGPLQFWFVGPEGDDLAARLSGTCVVTPLSHSRTRIYVEGPSARDVLAKGIAIDLDPGVFRPGMFALTGLHHTPVLLHCVTPSRFEIYAMRTFSANAWEWLADAALEFTTQR